MIVKAVAATMKQVENNACSLQDETTFLQNVNQMLMRKHGEQKIVAGTGEWTLVKKFATHFVGMVLETVELFQSFVCKRYLSWTVIVKTCVGTRQDGLSNVLRMVITLVTSSL